MSYNARSDLGENEVWSETTWDRNRFMVLVIVVRRVGTMTIVMERLTTMARERKLKQISKKSQPKADLEPSCAVELYFFKLSSNRVFQGSAGLEMSYAGLMGRARRPCQPW